jgi:CheY-like chemotaxis protein
MGASDKRVLIVEDAADIRFLLKSLFETEGFVVDQAANGQEALEFLRSTDSLPALILLDLMMPVMDGYEFRSKQEAEPRLANIPVVVMTADGDISARRSSMRAREYLKKPVDINRLLSIARSACL